MLYYSLGNGSLELHAGLLLRMCACVVVVVVVVVFCLFVQYRAYDSLVMSLVKILQDEKV